MFLFFFYTPFGNRKLVARIFLSVFLFLNIVNVGYGILFLFFSYLCFYEFILFVMQFFFFIKKNDNNEEMIQTVGKIIISLRKKKGKLVKKFVCRWRSFDGHFVSKNSIFLRCQDLTQHMNLTLLFSV